QLMQDSQKGELSLWRERGLGLVQEVQTVLEAMAEEGQERLAVRLRVKRSASIATETGAGALQPGREVEERLRPQKEPRSRLLVPLEGQGFAQSRSVVVGRVLVAAVPSLAGEARAPGESFEQCRFARSV